MPHQPAQHDPRSSLDDEQASTEEIRPEPAAPRPTPPRPAPRPAPPDQARPAPRYAGEDAATSEIPVSPPAGHRAPTGVVAPSGKPRRLARRAGLVAAAGLGVLALLYGLDLALSAGEVPRGVTVGGVDVGGLQPSAAEQRLREQLEPRLTRPVSIRAGDVETTLDPTGAGLALDWRATLDHAGEQPLNPWTRFTSLFTNRDVGVVTSADHQALAAALEDLRRQTDRPPTEGTVRFEGSAPVPVYPVIGQQLDAAGARAAVLAGWVHGGTVQLPVSTTPVSTTTDGVNTAVTQVAQPAVSGPVTLIGQGGEAVLEPPAIAAALRFSPDGRGGLAATVDNAAVVEALAPQLAGTERPARDAGIVFQGGRPTVVPSADGVAVDWKKSLAPLMDVLTRTEGRTLPAVYVVQRPDLTTEAASRLGITGVISEFTTGGFAPDSGRNIRRVAEQVDGAIVKPGESFSLNRYTGPRNASNGYVEAGIIEDGRPTRGIGGGISQFATTLYNASYFAGMTDLEHKEHSYYISRYPVGREATVFEGAIDLRFRNDSDTGILIDTAWTPSSITVRFWGTKHVNVESITGPRTNYTDPQTKTITGEPCSPTDGSRGFTVTDTRVIRDAGSGAVIDRETRRVVYDPQPKIICKPAPGGEGASPG